MIRRAIVAACLLGVVGGGAGAAFASTASTTPVQKTDHQICIVLAKDASHAHTQDFCVNYS